MVDLLGQVWNLLTRVAETVDQILEAFQAIIQKPEILVKAFYDEVETLLGTDTLERAKKIGQIVGSFVPDIVVGALTAGVGVIGLKALQALKISQKVASNVIKLGKLVGKTLKLLTSSTEIVLTKIAGGVIGLSGRAAKALIGKLDDVAFGELLKLVKFQEQIFFLQKLRVAIKDFPKIGEHFSKHGKEIQEQLGYLEYNGLKYYEDALLVKNSGIFVPEMNGHAKFIKNNSKGKALFGFVGLDRNTNNITTFHIKSISELQKAAPNTFPK